MPQSVSPSAVRSMAVVPVPTLVLWATVAVMLAAGRGSAARM
ncbi:hypothetical protein OAG32_01365 [Akkermansiaceae bacterium]|nr:hypothetical protein [Akkermansiaceae bacterium]